MGVLPDKMDKVYPDIVQPNPPDDDPARSCPDLHIKNRKPTDVCFFIVFIMFFLVLFGFIGYCMSSGNINRILNGHDYCGSVCGPKPIDNSTDTAVIKCYEERDKNGSFGSYRSVAYYGKQEKRICTNSCAPGENLFLNRCLRDKNTSIILTKYYLVAVSEDMEIYWKQLIYLCLISLVFFLFVVLLFQYCVGFIVWIILIGVEMACICASVALWALWAQRYYDNEVFDPERKLWVHLGFAIGATLLTLIVGLIIFIMRKKIDLVIQIFEEAGKAISDMNGLLLVPILTFLAFVATISSWIYFTLWIASSGHLTLRPKHQNDFYYEKNSWMIVAGILNTVGMMWMIQFLIACQHMIVAGAVSKWYFTRNKDHLSSPVTESAYNLTRFHLGSVALGSFIVTLIQILKVIVSILQKALKKKTDNGCLVCILKVCLCLCNCCLHCLDWIVKTFSVNAYIVVAMYGHSFFKAGKQAFTRIVANPLSFAAINSVGDFVLFLAKVMVVVVAEASAMYLLKDKGIQHLWVFLALVSIFSLSIAHLFITLYEMTIDTIFICFCEDTEMNDGVSKPYYMSRGLMEYVDNSKKTLKMHDKKKIFENRQLRGEEIHTVSFDMEKKTKETV